MPTGQRVYVSVDLDVSRRANYLVNEIKLEWIKGRAVVRVQCYPVRWLRASGGTVGKGKIIGGKGMSAGIRLANAFISIHRGRVTCSPLRSISSTSFARSLSHPPSIVLFPTSLPFLFAFCFHFFSHLLVISLSLFLSVFRFVSFFLRISAPPLSLSLSLSLSISLILYSYSLYRPSLYTILFPFRFLFVLTTTYGVRIFPRLCLSGFGIEADVFRLNERR